MENWSYDTVTTNMMHVVLYQPKNGDSRRFIRLYFPLKIPSPKLGRAFNGMGITSFGLAKTLDSSNLNRIPVRFY